MFTVTQIKNHLVGLSHGATLNKVRNIEQMFERAASSYLLKVHPLDVVRKTDLSVTVHDDLEMYAAPYDFGILIDLIPEDDQDLWNRNFRRKDSPDFDKDKAFSLRVVNIDSIEGEKVIRIKWRNSPGKVLNTMDSLTANGTWSVVGSATGLKTNPLFKKSGSASIEFDLVATGDGIQNTTMDAIDLSDEDEVGVALVLVYFESITNLTSISAFWGNDLTTNLWTSVPQTAQADGTDFRKGWNILKFPWSSATESGTVDPAAIDSFKLTIAASGAISNIRVDNILFSKGRNFEVKYYSKFLFKSASTGLWISEPSSDDDYVMVDNDSLPIFLMECLEAMAHQVEGEDSGFDMAFAEKKMQEMFPSYRGNNPSMVKKSVGRYSSGPSRGRWGFGSGDRRF